MTSRILLFVSVVFFSTIWLSCKKKTVPDYRQDFVGVYSEGYESINISAGDSVNSIVITGIPYADYLEAIITNDEYFEFVVHLSPELDHYGGPGCGYCLLDPAHLFRRRGFGQKTVNGLYILAIFEKKYPNDSTFSIYNQVELNLIKYQ